MLSPNHSLIDLKTSPQVPRCQPPALWTPFFLLLLVRLLPPLRGYDLDAPHSEDLALSRAAPSQGPSPELSPSIPRTCASAQSSPWEHKLPWTCAHTSGPSQASCCGPTASANCRPSLPASGPQPPCRPKPMDSPLQVPAPDPLVPSCHSPPAFQVGFLLPVPAQSCSAPRLTFLKHNSNW